MSVLVDPSLRPGLEDNLLRLSSEPSAGRYAYRIGFVGDRIDRFHDALLGKVLAERSFQPHLHLTGSPQATATTLARRLLTIDSYPMYPSDRYRLVAAHIPGTKPDIRRLRQLDQAVTWLMTKHVNVIYFQHHWMVREIKIRYPDLQSYELERIPVM